MALGWLAGFFGILHNDSRVPLQALNGFVFIFGIPALVFRGLATTDFTDLNWTFVSAFLLLRLVSGVLLALITALYSAGLGALSKGTIGLGAFKGTIGLFLTHWIGVTWMNTLIFGVPLLQAIYGPGVVVLNVLAAISSLFFQLPVMLLLFDVQDLVSPTADPTDATAYGGAPGGGSGTGADASLQDAGA
eukprot:CAMPEP_0177672724 /NCGR_PEP_ID=MMETSP0447-20121125/25509_1 /TAXON_ID=0 /ORGANISM="Stygamoeba regulata, Strain BSH-02190019" /LENGTH=189 /DNA_ID=CAMNT_0019180441 /DNA_START=193 /DNA_END=759 /DNA_ORIENTATION=+